MDIQTFLAMIVRHGLTVLAGALAARGYLDSSATEGFISAGMTLAAVGWSFWQKSGQAELALEVAMLRARMRGTTGAAVRDALANKQ